MKLCKRCKEFKNLDSFYKRLDKEARCKSCVSELRRTKYKLNRVEKIAKAKIYRDANPEKIRDGKLRQAYGVGLEYFNAKLKEQGGTCAGCRKQVKTVWRGKEVNMALDHDHKTGKPRGILCMYCNTTLGIVKEDTQTLLNLVDYMNKYKK